MRARQLPVPADFSLVLAPAIQASFDQLLASGELPLPVLPEVASQVLSLVQRPDCDTARLAELLRRDPAMTAHVMSVAASPMYIGATKISSLQQAIGRLGFATITQIVMAVASKTRVFEVKGFEQDVKAAFKHALVTALFAQEIAKLRRSTVDIAFLSGLFHDFGEPVLMQALVDLHRAHGVPAERAVVIPAVNEAHAQIGAKLCEKWQMPPKVAEAVGRHHAPEGCELATLVALADQFAHGLEPSQELAAKLNLYPDDLVTVGKRADDITATAKVIS
ncbi:MAG TPA: HDOD domain-containing protein [Kofleriaceae bacterium]